MSLPRSLAVLFFAAAAAGAAAPARAQTNDAGEPVFPTLLRTEGDVQQEELQPSSVPPSQGPFGEQPLVPTPPDHPVPPPEAPSPWVITPQLLLSTTATDNAALTQTDRQADLQALINPSVTVTGDTQSAKVDLNYSPMILRNVVVTSGDIVDQNFFGTGTFVGVPDALFLNLRGSSSEGSRGGSMGPIDPIDLRSGDRTEVLAYDGGPEWRFPLGDAATGDLRYTFGQARFYDNTGLIVADQPLVTNPITDSTVQDLRLYLDSGDRSDLVSGQFTADATRTRISAGQGTDDSGIVMVEGQLRLTPVFQLLGSVGYEDLRYSVLSFADVNDPTWYGGFRWQDAKDSYVTLTYGHRQGIDSFAGDMHYPITPLTSIFANYGVSITTPQQQILGNLDQAQLNSNNIVINPETGLPQALLANELALQDNLYRETLFRSGITTTNEPDTYTLAVSYEGYTPLSGASGNDAFIGGDAIWDHALDETTSFALTLGYYTREQLHENTALFQVGLSRLITDSLLAGIGYEFDYGGSDLGVRTFYRDALTAYLRKTF